MKTLTAEERYQEKNDRFEKFTKALAKLSQEHGVTLDVTGGVWIMSPEEQMNLITIEYDSDPSSGDLRCYVNFKG